MKEHLILIGGGGHAKACIDVIESSEQFQIAGIVDLEENLHKEILGYEIIATEDELESLVKQYKNFLITIGQVTTPAIRKEKYNKLKELGAVFPTIASSRAHISKHATVGEGTIVMHNAVVNANANVGVNCIINTGAIVEHDAEVGAHSHISTGCIINGGAKVGDDTFLGSKSVVREKTEICESVVIGSGGVVVKPITEQGTYAGNPVRKIS